MKFQKDTDQLGCLARKWGMRFQPVRCNMMQITRKQIKKIGYHDLLKWNGPKQTSVGTETDRNGLQWKPEKVGWDMIGTI